MARSELEIKTWRRERDSNPRYGFPYSGFQDRLFQPLTHPSATYKLHNRKFIVSLALHYSCAIAQTLHKAQAYRLRGGSMARFQRGYVYEASNAFHVRYWSTELRNGKAVRVQKSERLCAKDDKHHSTLSDTNGTPVTGSRELSYSF